MTRLVILVDFRVTLESRSEFGRLIQDNAAASLASEPGCLQFDVLLPEGGSGERFTLYEIYADPAAFDAHLRTDHYRQFDAAVAGMVTDKMVTRLRFVDA